MRVVAMRTPVPAALSLAAVLAVTLAVASAHAAPTSAIVGGLEMSLLDGRASPAGQGLQQQQQPQQQQGGRPTTARLERVYSSSAKQAAYKAGGAARPASESYARTGTRVHLTPAGTPSENPAPCAVAGRHFLHGQQVTRPDPCEFCVCLDGEVFCWWQDCPPSTAQGPCRGRAPFSSCQDDSTAAPAASAASAAAAPLGTSGDVSGGASEQVSPEGDGDAPANDTAASSAASTVPPSIAGAGVGAATGADATSSGGQPTTGAAQDPTSNPQAELPEHSEQSGTEAASTPTGPTGAEEGGTGASSNSNSSSIIISSSVTQGVATTASPVNATTTSAPTTTELLCHVLGSTYRVGEVLPRDTGSCLQCECSPVGRVTCSPKDCLSVREEEDVYQPASSLDMFDVDSF
ncbi:tropomyosin-1, isoforms 33/34-like [Frankliniella occidentalis]|uniref:Tropomyosin-1, isoforms 33/34-like n=1 Tax=Frankliniella occidentalis TaxID=133901 RepID=A0A6J1RUA7_FRAOC|nr:tropomyosin-1, isoforms 33/34-like [Frankliniella occidentalis]XP_052129016.1 tropomyosin-1, isoforms 33/34-like [Frankliniella occidentalis]